MKDFYVSFPCCYPALRIPGLRRGDRLEEPAAGNLHGGVCEGGESPGVTASLNGHETVNGGNSQGEPKANRNLLYSEVDRDQLREVILQESAPALRRWLAAAHHVLAYAAFPDVDTEFEQLAVDAGCTPTGILPAYLADQMANVAANDRSSGLAAPHLPGPEQAKAGTMPGNDGLGLNDG